MYTLFRTNPTRGFGESPQAFRPLLADMRILRPLFYFLVGSALLLVLLTSSAIGLLFWRQDAVVKQLLEVVNEDFEGRITIRGSHVSPFAAFPYISIDLEDLKVFADKDTAVTPILHIGDTYLGFDLLTLISGQMDIKTIRLSSGDINLVQDTLGEFNLMKAFATTKEIEDPSTEFHVDLQRITLKNVDITKLNEADNVFIDLFVNSGTLRFEKDPKAIDAGVESDFVITVKRGQDTTFIRNKHFHVNTALTFDKKTHVVNIAPSELKLGEALFSMGGTVDVDDDMLLDLTFKGEKPSFELFIAFAPEELVPTLRRYDNQGRVFFMADVKGKSINGHAPRIDANFGCENAYFANAFNKKKVDELQFKGFFTTGESGAAETMELVIKDFSSRPEAGVFKADLSIKNFESPEVEMLVESDFDLAFLAQFLEIEGLSRLKGKVQLTMNFHDIIDLEHPERSLDQLNQAYFSELRVTDLSFVSPDLPVAVNDLDIHATMNGAAAQLHFLDLKAGSSDIAITGSISDLPAVIHHAPTLVSTDLSISSKLLDLAELTRTKGDTMPRIRESIRDFSADLRFQAKANSFTESPNLPIGEFFIENLYASMDNYPHTLHDFRADVFVEAEDFRVIDFSGEIDSSDFHFSGRLTHYDLWFEKHPFGDTKLEFDLTSNLLKLNDLLTYDGVNYLPADYRHEELRQFKLHGRADLHFKDSLHSTDLYLDQLTARMQTHPLKLEDFKGRFHIEDEHLMVSEFKGRIGHSTFEADMNYYYGKNPKVRLRDNHLRFSSPRLDIDELTNFTLPEKDEPVNHDSVFNIYELPFTDMRFVVDVKNLNYHHHRVENITGRLRTTQNHFLHLDTLSMDVAGGHIDLRGYFNGENSKAIYFSPDIRFRDLDMGKLMLKFDNFGQDELVADNLQGRITGRLTGKLHMHADMVPMMDDSNIKLDLEVLDGRIANYAPLLALGDFFADRNLNKILFDTLRNSFDMTNGALTVPAMTINTSLGFVEISGKQDKDMNMDYLIRVPFQMITSAAASKLFGRKKEDIDPDREDEIIRRDPKRKTRFVSIRITGTPESYKVALAK